MGSAAFAPPSGVIPGGFKKASGAGIEISAASRRKSLAFLEDLFAEDGTDRVDDDGPQPPASRSGGAKTFQTAGDAVSGGAKTFQTTGDAALRRPLGPASGHLGAQPRVAGGQPVGGGPSKPSKPGFKRPRPSLGATPATPATPARPPPVPQSAQGASAAGSDGPPTRPVSNGRRFSAPRLSIAATPQPSPSTTAGARGDAALTVASRSRSPLVPISTRTPALCMCVRGSSRSTPLNLRRCPSCCDECGGTFIGPSIAMAMHNRGCPNNQRGEPLRKATI